MSFFEEVQQNLAFVAVFAGIVFAMFVVAYVVEKVAKKKSGDTERILSTRKVAVIGVFSAVATILYIFDFPLPFAPSFYKLDFSEIPVLVCGFAFGPVAGVMTEFVKVLLKLVIKGTTTAFVGDLANFVVGCALILPATIIYRFVKSRKGAVIACVVGTLCITVCGTLFNAYYLLPTFAVMYGMPLDALIGMGTKINPAITDVSTFVLFAVAPLNIVKGAAVSLVTMLVYKKLSPIMKYGSAPTCAKPQVQTEK